MTISPIVKRFDFFGSWPQCLQTFGHVHFLDMERTFLIVPPAPPRRTQADEGRKIDRSSKRSRAYYAPSWGVDCSDGAAVPSSSFTCVSCSCMRFAR
jgi:hypothetical protein